MALVKRSQRTEPWPGFLVRPPAWPDLFHWPEEIMSPLLEEEGMRLEEYTEDGSLVIRAELPGIDPDNDVEITVSDGTLHIRAERREEKKEEKKGSYRSEFRYGAFSRSLPLPAGADESDISAKYESGILEVRIPVDAAKAETTRVPVSRSPEDEN